MPCFEALGPVQFLCPIPKSKCSSMGTVAISVSHAILRLSDFLLFPAVAFDWYPSPKRF